jgi:hypothetical protein
MLETHNVKVLLLLLLVLLLVLLLLLLYSASRYLLKCIVCDSSGAVKNKQHRCQQ